MLCALSEPAERQNNSRPSPREIAFPLGHNQKPRWHSLAPDHTFSLSSAMSRSRSVFLLSLFVAVSLLLHTVMARRGSGHHRLEGSSIPIYRYSIRKATSLDYSLAVNSVKIFGQQVKAFSSSAARAWPAKKRKISQHSEHLSEPLSEEYSYRLENMIDTIITV